MVSATVLAVLATALATAPAAAQAPERSTRFDDARRVTTRAAFPGPTAGPASGSGLQAAGPDSDCRPASPCIRNAGLGAVGGTAVGALAGGAVVLGYAALAYGLGDSDDGGPWFLAIYGGIVGAGLGMPLGAHLANGRRGSLAADYLVPVLATSAVSWVVREADGRIGVAIPVTLLASVVATEVLTAR